MKGNACGIPWGICPEHGQTLRASGAQSWCMVCGRRWDFDRLGQRCSEPVCARVLDALGAELEVCRGHALAADARLVGCTITLLPGSDRSSGQAGDARRMVDIHVERRT